MPPRNPIPPEVLRAVHERAKGKCEMCKTAGDWRGLAPHHRRFRSHGGEHTVDNLEYLCGKCHSLRHGIVEV